jgi:hypothetical protein
MVMTIGARDLRRLLPAMISLFLAAAALLSARPARAQGAGNQAPASLEAREAEAQKACAAGQVDRGIQILAELLVQTSHPNYVYNQARCYQQNGLAAQALQRFREYLREARDISAADRSQVEGFIRELEADLARKSPPPGGGEATSPRPQDAPARATPQPDLRAGVPPQTGDDGHTLRVAAMALGGVAVLGLGAGAVFGLQARSLEREVEGWKGTGSRSQDELGDKNSAGKRYQTLQWVGYGVGAAALVAAVVCFVSGQPRGESATASAAAGGGGLTFRF